MTEFSENVDPNGTPHEYTVERIIKSDDVEALHAGKMLNYDLFIAAVCALAVIVNSIIIAISAVDSDWCTLIGASVSAILDAIVCGLSIKDALNNLAKKILAMIRSKFLRSGTVTNANESEENGPQERVSTR